ncbi:hypothetical protein MBLNU459_g5023t1 [Dothideomycetes sp. NU459]
MPSIRNLTLLLLSAVSAVKAQTVSSSESGYAGYTLGVTGDRDSAAYATEDTVTTNSSVTVPAPDVFLNASLHVGEIDITVSNLSAKVNLDAEVLSLLSFNAGVNVSISRVNLQIQNVTAKVLLEARLANLATMIGDVLDSIDLNPVIATLGAGVGDVVDGVGSALTGSSSTSSSSSASSSSNLTARSYDLVHNILYSVNDYSGNTHTNRILEQDGTIVDQYLDNHGAVHGQKLVGTYLQDMTFTGYNQSTTAHGLPARVLEYIYAPYYGLSIISAITVDEANKVVAARVLSESSAGGMSTISNDV